MTIEELKDLGEVETGEALFDLRNEILALVEATQMYLDDSRADYSRRIFAATNAFNAKMASL